MPGLVRGYVSRHVRREKTDELGGRSAGEHRHACVVSERDVTAGRDRDPQRIDPGRGQDERSSRALTHLTAANDRIRRARAQADDRNEDRGREKHREKAHPHMEST